VAIKHIVFDFGNVLFDLDFPGCYQKFYSALGLTNTFPNFPKELEEVFFSYEKGVASEEEMLRRINKYAPALTIEQFKVLWNSLLVSMPKQRIDWVKQLGAIHNIYLLSNINNWHRKAIDFYLLKHYKIQQFERNYFKKYFYSYEMGLRKPEPKIYKEVELALNASPQEIFFISVNIVYMSTLPPA